MVRMALSNVDNFVSFCVGKYLTPFVFMIDCTVLALNSRPGKHTELNKMFVYNYVNQDEN